MKNWIVALGLLLLALTAFPVAAEIQEAMAPGLHAATMVAQTDGDDDDEDDDEDGEEDVHC